MSPGAKQAAKHPKCGSPPASVIAQCQSTMGVSVGSRISTLLLNVSNKDESGRTSTAETSAPKQAATTALLAMHSGLAVKRAGAYPSTNFELIAPSSPERISREDSTKLSK